MPFGLTKAPAVFQALVNAILQEYLNFVLLYLDDILIFSPDLKTHQKHFRPVIQWLLHHDLFVKAEKCEFHSPSMSFLGFIVAEANVNMDPQKVAAIRDRPILSNRKQLQRFLGFANFYQ